MFQRDDDVISKLLPMFQGPFDVINKLRTKLVVGIVPDAYLIRVALESQDAEGAAIIVNAVVDAYRASNEAYTADANRRLRKSLGDEEKRLDGLIKRSQTELKALLEKGTVTIDAKDVLAAKAAKDQDSTQPTFSSVTEQHYQDAIAEMMKTESDLIKAESRLKVLQEVISREKPSQSVLTAGRGIGTPHHRGIQERSRGCRLDCTDRRNP